MIRNEAPTYKKEEEKKIFKLKSTAEAQRLRLERLMSDPVGEMLNERHIISSETVAETVAALQQTSSATEEKPHAKLNKVIVIPERSKDHAPKAPPEFIRNIWGSSAGVGSGDFHIYRGIRRREYARQKYNQYLKEKEEKDRKFDEKLQKNVEAADAKTAKKRAKRLKQKERLKRKRQQKKQESDSEDETSDEESESSDTGEGEQKPDGEDSNSQPIESKQSNTKPPTSDGDSSLSCDENGNIPQQTTSNDADESSNNQVPESDTN